MWSWAAFDKPNLSAAHVGALQWITGYFESPWKPLCVVFRCLVAGSYESTLWCGDTSLLKYEPLHLFCSFPGVFRGPTAGGECSERTRSQPIQPQPQRPPAQVCEYEFVVGSSEALRSLVWKPQLMFNRSEALRRPVWKPQSFSRNCKRLTVTFYISGI